MLSPEQIAHFEAFGFLLLPRLLDPGEAATLKREAEEVFEEDRGGQPFSGETTEYVQPFFERRPFLFSLLDDDRIYDIGVDLCGPDFVLDQTEGRLRVEPTAWHAGDPFPSGLRWIKIGFYPETLTRDSGCLRVVPGTHIPRNPDPMAPLRRTGMDPGYRPFGLAQEEIPHVPSRWSRATSSSSPSPCCTGRSAAGRAATSTPSTSSPTPGPMPRSQKSGKSTTGPGGACGRPRRC